MIEINRQNIHNKISKQILVNIKWLIHKKPFNFGNVIHDSKMLVCNLALSSFLPY